MLGFYATPVKAVGQFDLHSLAFERLTKACRHRRPRASRDLFLSQDFLADVRPELLEKVIQDRGFHLRSKVQSRLTEAPLLRRIISVGQTSFQSIAHHFREVEARTSGVCFSNEAPGYRVAGAA